MIKKIVILVTFSLFPYTYSLQARPISPEDAKQFAQNWVLEKWARQVEMDKQELISTGIEEPKADPLYYVLNFPQGGWMIVAADDTAYPVIAFSPTGSYSEQQGPVQFEAWMNTVKEEVSNAIQKNYSPLPAADAAWKRFKVDTKIFSSQQVLPHQQVYTATSVAPLLSTKWDQGTYYNASCPTNPQT
ncbi:MAG: hypothetical protein D3923_18630, partial [Candidatus Electrothrix sp. AR3]|nr:hypothetical protein [Candidatus Electrothrix sp. AR3]